MKKHLVCIAVTLLLLCLGVTQSFAAGVNFVAGLATTSVALGASDSVRASVKVIEVPKDYPYDRAYMWGGDEDSSPQHIIETISIFRNGKLIYIPMSAFSDLGNPAKILLKRLSSDSFRLVINGGDAAGSYSAILDFRGNEIYRRKVISNEFPKEVWEETKFSFNDLNN